MLLITVLQQPPVSGSSQVTVQMLRSNLFSALLSLPTIQVINMVRYGMCCHDLHFTYAMHIFHKKLHSVDGCEPESFEGINWPETDLNSVARGPCTCTEFVGSLAGKVIRLCGGSYSQGARWVNNLDYSQCSVRNSEITNKLCEAAQVYNVM